MKHLPVFLTEPHKWIGEGKISLTAVDEKLRFFTRWQTAQPQYGELAFEAKQEIQIAGHSDIMHNAYDFYSFAGKTFQVELENSAWGKVTGEGVFDPAFIGWEFKNTDDGFEGFEYYKLQEDGSYTVHAEFSTSKANDFRTTIEGKIWKQLVGSTDE